ncbi:MAG TPA: GNAT family N-acetyltransferase [Silvibacterium sp.]|nr:GNAT family N-acetyltransferase [Silvibacterium sp.]
MAAIRFMTAGDIDALLKLAAETPEAPDWDRAAYEYTLVGNDEQATFRAAWVAVNGADLLGFAVARLIGEICELESIVVARSTRRKGIGKALLDGVIGWALAAGARKIQLEVRAANESAIAFYAHAGFLTEGLRPGYYRNPDEDAVLMGKPLFSGD